MTNLEKPSNPISSKLNKLVYSFIVVALVGLLDAVFLTVKHYTGDISCSLITGCQEVLSSSYSVIFGIPTALLGAGYYIVILLAALIYAEQKKGLIQYSFLGNYHNHHKKLYKNKHYSEIKEHLVI